VKKKYTVSSKDKKDWIDFTQNIDDVQPKEDDLQKENPQINQLPKLDLHGYSLSESNVIVKKFITETFELGYKKLLIVTGKGSRSKSYDNPYVSEKLHVLKYSIPEFIKNDEDIKNKISNVSEADIRDGGEGAIYIFLKNKKKL
tara:strand:+ start:165 stop:596 length:432 start_codon:yes stop_codon:yes gene_type:complete